MPLVQFAGFPIALPAGALEPCFGAQPAAAEPVLRIETAAALPEGSSGDLLPGEGFVLDLAARRVCIAQPANTLPFHDGPRLRRIAMLSLALLAEHHGPAPIAAAHPQGLAPLALHAAAVQGPRGALVFCGHSTFGKTTIARQLLDAYPLLGEDLLFVLAGPVDGGSNAPQAAVFLDREQLDAASCTLPLAGLFWLEKSPGFALHPMSAAEAAACLAGPVFGAQRTENAAHRLQLLRLLLNAVPCQRLAFAKDRAELLRFLKASQFL